MKGSHQDNHLKIRRALALKILPGRGRTQTPGNDISSLISRGQDADLIILEALVFQVPH
jgi:hypothetical protein